MTNKLLKLKLKLKYKNNIHNKILLEFTNNHLQPTINHVKPDSNISWIFFNFLQWNNKRLQTDWTFIKNVKWEFNWNLIQINGSRVDWTDGRYNWAPTPGNPWCICGCIWTRTRGWCRSWGSGPWRGTDAWFPPRGTSDCHHEACWTWNTHNIWAYEKYESTATVSW